MCAWLPPWCKYSIKLWSWTKEKTNWNFPGFDNLLWWSLKSGKTFAGTIVSSEFWLRRDWFIIYYL